MNKKLNPKQKTFQIVKGFKITIEIQNWVPRHKKTFRVYTHRFWLVMNRKRKLILPRFIAAEQIRYIWVKVQYSQIRITSRQKFDFIKSFIYVLLSFSIQFFVREIPLFEMGRSQFILQTWNSRLSCYFGLPFWFISILACCGIVCTLGCRASRVAISNFLHTA